MGAAAGIEVTRRKGRSVKLFREAHAVEAGQIIADGIRASSARGESVTGQAFPPYRDPRRSGPGRVDLRDTGAMLEGVGVVEASQDGVAVGPAVPYAREVNARFPFVGLSPAVQQQVSGYLGSKFRELLARSGVDARRTTAAANAAERGDDEDDNIKTRSGGIPSAFAR